MEISDITYLVDIKTLSIYLVSSAALTIDA